MKRSIVVGIALSSLVLIDANAQIPKERAARIAAESVVTFGYLCLDISAEYRKRNAWLAEHTSQEDVTQSANSFREKESDRVFEVRGDLSRTMVTFSNNGKCTVYGHGVDKPTAEEFLRKVMDTYAATRDTHFEQDLTSDKALEQTSTYVEKNRNDGDRNLRILISYVPVGGEDTFSLKASSVSLERTSNKLLQPIAPKDGAPAER